MITKGSLGLTVLLACAPFSLAGADEPKAPDGVQVLSTGNSFHCYVPGMLHTMASKAGIQGHALVHYQQPLSGVAGEKKGKLTAELARKLLPEAASISAVDFQKLAEDPGLVKSKSLSLVLLGIDPEIADKNPMAAKEFRHLGQGTINVVKLVEALSISKAKGYASYIQPVYITDCTCESTDARAEGIVTFKSKLFEGRIPFVAESTKDGWVITEFRLPQYKTKVVRGKDGIWKQEELKGK